MKGSRQIIINQLIKKSKRNTNQSRQMKEFSKAQVDDIVKLRWGKLISNP